MQLCPTPHPPPPQKQITSERSPPCFVSKNSTPKSPLSVWRTIPGFTRGQIHPATAARAAPHGYPLAIATSLKKGGRERDRGFVGPPDQKRTRKKGPSGFVHTNTNSGSTKAIPVWRVVATAADQKSYDARASMRFAASVESVVSVGDPKDPEGVCVCLLCVMHICAYCVLTMRLLCVRARLLCVCAFYRRRGDDSSITLTPPQGETCK